MTQGWLRAACAQGASPLARVGLAAAALVGTIDCAAPEKDATSARPPLLYVANAADGTLTRLDAASGLVLGPSIAVPPGAWQVVAGADGSALVLSTAARRGNTLTRVVRGGAGWAATPVSLEAGANELVAVGRLAGDGGHYAAVEYDVWAAGTGGGYLGCRLALVDLHTGAVTGGQPVCTAGEAALSLALADTPAGLVAYVGLWVWSTSTDGTGGSGTAAHPRTGRILAFNVQTGARAGVFPTAGAPVTLATAAAPGGAGWRVYLVDAVPGPERDDGEGVNARAERWLLVGLDPATMFMESYHVLAESPLWLSVAPGGDRAYALAGRDGNAGGSSVLRIDLVTGAVDHLLTLPGRGHGLVVTSDHLCVVDADHDRLWWVHRERGSVERTIVVGHHPIAIALSG